MSSIILTQHSVSTYRSKTRLKPTGPSNCRLRKQPSRS